MPERNKFRSYTKIDTTAPYTFSLSLSHTLGIDNARAVNQSSRSLARSLAGLRAKSLVLQLSSLPRRKFTVFQGATDARNRNSPPCIYFSALGSLSGNCGPPTAFSRNVYIYTYTDTAREEEVCIAPAEIIVGWCREYECTGEGFLAASCGAGILEQTRARSGVIRGTRGPKNGILVVTARWKLW